MAPGAAREAVLDFGRRCRLYDASNGWQFTHVLGRLADARRNRGDCYAQAEEAGAAAGEEAGEPAPKRPRR